MSLQEQFDTTNLLRPHQVAETREELRIIESTLNAPPHIRGKITDAGGMRKRAMRLTETLEKYSPKPYGEGERDTAVSEFKRLSEEIKVGMPSSVEMRRNMPGAVGKHMAWQKKNAKRIARWKHIGQRLLAGGDVSDQLSNGSDLTNVETLRKLETPHDLSLEGSQIPKTRDMHIGADPGGTVVFSDAELKLLRDARPDLEENLALMDNETRASIKGAIANAIAKFAPPPIPDDTEEKHTAEELGYNGMKMIAKKYGIKTFGIKKEDLISLLRERNLVA